MHISRNFIRQNQYCDRDNSPGAAERINCWLWSIRDGQSLCQLWGAKTKLVKKAFYRVLNLVAAVLGQNDYGGKKRDNYSAVRRMKTEKAHSVSLHPSPMRLRRNTGTDASCKFRSSLFRTRRDECPHDVQRPFVWIECSAFCVHDSLQVLGTGLPEHGQ